jgi:hypothetical protein
MLSCGRRAGGDTVSSRRFSSTTTSRSPPLKPIDTGLLSPDEANAEKTILKHFVPVVATLRTESRTSVGAFKNRLTTERDRLAPLVLKLIQFAENAVIRVPVFLVSNPEQASGGGEANGGRIVVEVPGPDPLGILLHESFHVLLAGRAADVRRAADTAGLHSAWSTRHSRTRWRRA